MYDVRNRLNTLVVKRVLFTCWKTGLAPTRFWCLLFCHKQSARCSLFLSIHSLSHEETRKRVKQNFSRQEADWVFFWLMDDRSQPVVHMTCTRRSPTPVNMISRREEGLRRMSHEYHVAFDVFSRCVLTGASFCSLTIRFSHQLQLPDAAAVCRHKRWKFVRINLILIMERNFSLTCNTLFYLMGRSDGSTSTLYILRSRGVRLSIPHRFSLHFEGEKIHSSSLSPPSSLKRLHIHKKQDRHDCLQLERKDWTVEKKTCPRFQMLINITDRRLEISFLSFICKFWRRWWWCLKRHSFTS